MPPRTVRVLRTLALLAALFAFCIVMFGAFVRLSNAGLSCPDWPTCYGKATWPGHAQDIAQANEAFPDRPYETHKAWREQVHRFLAGGLGFMVLAIALISAWRRRVAVIAVLLAAVFAVIGVVMYMRGEHMVSSCLSALAIALPLIAAATLDRPGAWKIRRRRPGGDHLPGHARHVDGDPATEADRGDGPPARWPGHVRAARVGGIALVASGYAG
jgi:cytochrome c oxidase assembly protein subunit 15